MMPSLRQPSNTPMQQTALRFQKEGHCIVKLVTFVKRSASSSWGVVTPQLMGRAVRRRTDPALSARNNGTLAT